MSLVKLTKTDGAKQQTVFVRPESVAWIQSASSASVPTPAEAQPTGSGSILHFVGGPGHTITVVETLEEVIGHFEADEMTITSGRGVGPAPQPPR
jgi:hypothetical protein